MRISLLSNIVYQPQLSNFNCQKLSTSVTAFLRMFALKKFTTAQRE